MDELYPIRVFLPDHGLANAIMDWSWIDLQSRGVSYSGHPFQIPVNLHIKLLIKLLI